MLQMSLILYLCYKMGRNPIDSVTVCANITGPAAWHKMRHRAGKLQRNKKLCAIIIDYGNARVNTNRPCMLVLRVQSGGICRCDGAGLANIGPAGIDSCHPLTLKLKTGIRKARVALRGLSFDNNRIPRL